MSTTYFDTLAYAKKLQASGVPQDQAEAHAEALASVSTDHLATKIDVAQAVKDLSNELKSYKNELLLKLGGLIVGGFGALAAFLKLMS